MLLEMVPVDREIVGDLKTWRAVSYVEHFAGSPLRCAGDAMAAYRSLGRREIESFETLCAAMERLILTATALLDEMPAEEDPALIVDVASLVFDPGTVSFEIGFRAGGKATLTLDEISDQEIAMTVTLDPPVASTAPFAAVRSMFVNPWRADVTAVSWRRSPQGELQQEPVQSFDRASGTQFRFERPQISLHNTSAPDLVFEDFAPRTA